MIFCSCCVWVILELAILCNVMLTLWLDVLVEDSGITRVKFEDLCPWRSRMLHISSASEVRRLVGVIPVGIVHHPCALRKSNCFI